MAVLVDSGDLLIAGSPGYCGMGGVFRFYSGRKVGLLTDDQSCLCRSHCHAGGGHGSHFHAYGCSHLIAVLILFGAGQGDCRLALSYCLVVAVLVDGDDLVVARRPGVGRVGGLLGIDGGCEFVLGAEEHREVSGLDSHLLGKDRIDGNLYSGKDSLVSVRLGSDGGLTQGSALHGHLAVDALFESLVCCGGSKRQYTGRFN